MRNPDCWYKNVCKLEDCSYCPRYDEMKFLMDSAGVPEAQRKPKNLRPTTQADTIVFKKLERMHENMESFVRFKNNVYLCSKSPGTAKTSWGIRLLLKYFDSIWAGNGREVRGLFIHTPSLLQDLKNFDHPLSEEYLYYIKNCDLVVWDDIATQSKISAFDYSQLLIFIDYRLLNGKSNIYTSNVTTKEELAQAIGSRLASRIYGSSMVLELTGKDMRGVDFDSFTSNKQNS